MTTVSQVKIVPFTSAQMYQLVNNIEDYPNALPGCTNSSIIFRSENEVKAKVEVSAKGFTKSFTTLNRLQKNKRIDMLLIEGPFKHLSGYWQFDEMEGNKCKIIFHLNFEFSSRFIAMLVDPMLNQIVDVVIEAFITWADRIYGSKYAS